MDNKIGEGIYAEFGSMFSLVGCQAIRTKNIKKLTDKQRETLLGLEEPHEVMIAWLGKSDLLRLRSLVDRGRWRFMDSEGVITTIPSRYAYVRQVVDGVAIVVMGGFGPASNVYKEGLIDTEGNELTPINYDYIGFFENGVAEVRIGQERGVINNKGELIELKKTEPVKVIALSEKIQDYCDKMKARLEELGMTEFVVFGNEFYGSYDGEDPILPYDVDVYELFEFCVPDMYGELRYEDYWELIRKVRIENGNLLFEVGAYCTFDGEENWRLHENFTKDDLVNEYGEKAVESHLAGLLDSFEDEDNLNLNKMIVR